MNAQEFFDERREWMGAPDAVQVYKTANGWEVLVRLDGPFMSAGLARGSATLLAADLADIYGGAQ